MSVHAFPQDMHEFRPHLGKLRQVKRRPNRRLRTRLIEAVTAFDTVDLIEWLDSPMLNNKATRAKKGAMNGIMPTANIIMAKACIESLRKRHVLPEGR